MHDRASADAWGRVEPALLSRNTDAACRRPPKGEASQRMSFRWWRLGSFGVVAVGVACGGTKLPPQLATTAAQQRAASRVELVDLVIGERARAEKVRDLYLEIESLMLETKQAQARELIALGGPCPRSDAETRLAFRRFREAEKNALKKYAGLQLELRRATTPEEFAKLDAIK